MAFAEVVLILRVELDHHLRLGRAQGGEDLLVHPERRHPMMVGLVGLGKRERQAADVLVRGHQSLPYIFETRLGATCVHARRSRRRSNASSAAPSATLVQPWWL